MNRGRVNYFPSLVFSETGILKNFCRKMSTDMLASSRFWHSLGGASSHGILSINVKVLVFSTGKNIFGCM